MKGILRAQYFSLFLVSLILTKSLCIFPVYATRPITKNTEFVRVRCKATTYPDLCYSTLSSHASEVGADPELLVQAALDVALKAAQSASATLAKIGSSHGLKPREIGAMKDCTEEVKDSVYEIKRSLGEMKHLDGPDFKMKISDVETWVSAALTDDDTCTDGFAGKSMNGAVKAAVREEVVKVAHLTSNALALVNAFAAQHKAELVN